MNSLSVRPRSFILAAAVAVMGIPAAHGHHPGHGGPVFITETGTRLTDEWARMEMEERANRMVPVIAMPDPNRMRLTALEQADADSLTEEEPWLPVVYTPPAGYGALMAESIAPFKPLVRTWWDSTYFYIESDNMPDRTMMPDLMVGITAWQQQIPLPVSYFFNTTNPENNTGSLGYGKPNVWRLPMVPVPAASPISLNGNFLRGAVAVAANGIAIFNPRNNRGEFSYNIGELDAYGGHCGLADDYHYHIAPVHLQSVVGADKPVAWALDGYPIYGFNEPDGSPQQPLDADGGHSHGSWGYHYHARGTAPANHAAPFLMDAMHGTVVNFGGQVDPQPEVQSMRPSGTGGYEAKAITGAAITAFLNPVAFTVDGSGHFVYNPSGVPSPDHYLMRYTVSGTAYDICWRLNRAANPKSLTITFRTPAAGTATTTYTNGANNRIRAYGMAAKSMTALPDTGATKSGTDVFGEDADYSIRPPSFTDNGNGTVTDNVTGLMWQKTDNGESTWEAAVTAAATLNLGGYTDWRLPTPAEAFSILNHANSPAVNPTYFPSNAAGAAEYWWTSDIYGTDATKVWCTNSGGGLGAHPKAETISAGGTKRFHARYVRGEKPTNGHNYVNNGDGTVTDTDTGLMWTQAPSAAMNWSAAISHAESLTTGGYSDWRLPNVKELQSLVDITLATSTSAATAIPCLHRALFPAATATACWSSTPLRSGGTPTQAWLVEFGINTAATPQRNAQGIVSYEPFASTYPVFAVRNSSAVSRSISQGRATTTTPNLLPAGQRISGVGSITATDGTVWTVPAAMQFTSGPKAGDLYNEVTGVTPPNITAATPAITAAPTVVVDADGEVITGYIFADNYFELYVNGTLVGVDPVPYTPFNSCFVKFKAKRPVTYAFRLVDWEENLGLGTELNGGNPHHPGDGGLMASFSDGTVTNGNWKAQSFYIAPLDNPELVVEQPNGTHDSSAATAHTLTETAYAIHYPVPAEWFSKTFSDAGWPSAATYAEATVGVDNKPAFTNFPAQFSTSGAQFIWASNLVLDNEVIVRYTGPGLPPPQAPVISEVRTTPNTPTYVDTVAVAARIQVDAATSLSGATLTYSDGSFTTGPVFTETMAATAVTPWTGTGANNPWTITSLSGANAVRQLTAANHGTGNPCGLQFDKGDATLANTMAATAANISAAGTSGYVEFWLGTTGMISPNGWTFQLSSDSGATWTTRLSELTGSNHAMQLYHYDLAAAERVNTLRMRFQFAGYPAVAPTPAPKCSVDDISVVTTSGSPPVSLAMLDDGAHGDGLAGDGVFGAFIPVMPGGTNVSYSITATDNAGGTTTAPSASYTVTPTAPAGNFFATAELTGSSVVIQWPAQPGFTYSVQWSEDLIHWNNVPVGQTGTWTDLNITGPARKRFYRVMR
jgi:hypothetical protein